MGRSRALVGRYGMLVLAALALAALTCVGVLAPPVAGLASSGQRVVAAVRAGYPDLCNEWRDELVASPSPASWYTSWDVGCISGYTASEYRLMTVNVVTCEWRQPVELSLDWRAMLGAITAPAQRMPRCP